MAIITYNNFENAIKLYGPPILCGIGGLWVAGKIFTFTGNILGNIKQKRMLARWNETPKDVVIVHRYPSGKTCPNISPFVLKLETYLRMAKIPYEVDEKDIISVKGKCPWISLNGEHVADSQLCIEFLAKKFGKVIGKYSPEERAMGTMARITADEHFYWGLILWRYVYTEGRDYHKFFDHYPQAVLSFMIKYLGGSTKMKKQAFFQGIGRHSEEDALAIACSDLRALSTFIGAKPFLLGKEPCEDDAAVFGELAQIVWCCPDSPFEKLINEELHNLKEYCFRMKEIFWPDWDDWLSDNRKSSMKKVKWE